jgi:DNA mismatch repair protein MutS2
MLKAGLPLPAAPGCEAGPFDDVLADVGDAQSLDLSLSTFSARMQALARILDRAGPRDLVLLDEVCAGTDPEEGAALATAAVEALVEKGAAVVATTHYPALKERALSDERFENASVGFDPETLGPTYELHLGVPGPSAALHVASVCGVPASVVEKARARVPEARLALSDAAQRIEAAERRADAARREAEANLALAEAARARAEREVEAGREKGKRLAEKEARELVESVRRAKTALSEAEGRIRRRRVQPEDVRSAKEKLGRVAEVVAPGGPVAVALAPAAPKGRPATEADLAVGTRVWLAKMSHEGTVVALPAKGQVKVAAGPMRLTVKIGDLAILPPKEKSAARPTPATFDPAGDATNPAQTDSNTVDVRGLRADEAEAEVERFLDRLLREGKTAGFVVHGHGSGALRKAIRAQLSKSRYVARHRPGEDGEGGDGVTVVWIA